MKKIINNLLSLVGLKIVRILPGSSRMNSIYKKYKEYTMIEKEKFINNLILVDRIHSIGGSVVECGVWKGGMSAAIADLLGNSRHYYLFDSFEGLPEAKEIDGQSAIDWQKDKNGPWYFDNCTADIKYAEECMKKTGVNSFDIVKGWFSETLSKYKMSEGIAILRIDADWYDSTMECFENFFPKVKKGGLILLDDYYTWDGCSRAVHDYLSKNQRTERILNFENVYYMIKK